MTPDQNKQSAISFLESITTGKIQDAYATLVSANFRHHNAYNKGDATSLKAGMEENEKQFPQKKFEIQRAVAEHDLVMIHSRIQLAPDKPHIAVVHIFRFAEAKILEMWDVGQIIPEDSPNENGAF